MEFFRLKKSITGGLLLLLLGIILSGCATPYSKRYAVSGQVTGQKGDAEAVSIIDLPDVSLHVTTDNAVRTSFKCALLMPIPIPIYVKLDDNPKAMAARHDKFNVLLAAKPKRAGFSLNAKAIELHLDGATIPATAVAVDLIVERNGAPAVCTDLRNAKGRRSEQAGIANDGNWHCYAVYFDVATPSPDKEFSLNLSGLSLNGKPYAVPEVRFQKTEFSEGGWSNVGLCEG